MLKRLVVTGYKQHELGIFDENHPGIAFIKKALKSKLLSLLDTGLEWVIISGQLGVETWTAELVLELKDEYPNLKYALITPFLEQEKNWNETKQETYRSLIEKADYHNSLTQTPYEAPWQFIEKNKFFMRNSDGILIVYDEENEGSPKFIKQAADRYAARSEYQVLTITADDLQAIAEEEQLNEWY
ncbi:SLOG family protein [Sporosarcina sp. CAU 1771]